MALGASVLLNLVPLASAADAPTSPAATERWKRLKNQYEVTAPATKPQQLDQPKANAALSAKPVALTTKQPELADDPFDIPEAVRALREQPETELPGPFGTSDLEPETSPLGGSSGQQAPVEDKSNPIGRPSPRSLGAQTQGGPPRKTTQVRRISDIAPLNDFDKDTEIKQYAAEKAREFNVKFGGESYTPRNFPEVGFCWTAPTTKYYPLYFQDPALERYGHTHHHLIQPVISSARFSGQLVMMPYQMAIVPPWELHSPLGWYRPGDVVPKLRYPFPWSAKAAAIEAAAVTGFIYVIP